MRFAPASHWSFIGPARHVAVMSGCARSRKWSRCLLHGRLRWYSSQLTGSLLWKPTKSSMSSVSAAVKCVADSAGAGDSASARGAASFPHCGHERLMRSHWSMQSAWSAWRHGRIRSTSSSSNSIRQIVHCSPTMTSASPRCFASANVHVGSASSAEPAAPLETFPMLSPSSRSWSYVICDGERLRAVAPAGGSTPPFMAMSSARSSSSCWSRHASASDSSISSSSSSSSSSSTSSSSASLAGASSSADASSASASAPPSARSRSGNPRPPRPTRGPRGPSRSRIRAARAASPSRRR
mmetsp:Transcript_15119/g.46700  ORF Transcript_15119/g.46700 Transcript_15119/m.46700 type:complete len:297 (-) Transcript_15119:1547-2437(-)